jgi:leucyl-tRNA synthetase
VKLTLAFPITSTPAEIEAAVLASDQVTKHLEGKTPSKVIVVPKRIVNIVLGK